MLLLRSLRLAAGLNLIPAQRLVDGRAARDVATAVHAAGAERQRGERAGHLVVVGERTAAIKATKLGHSLTPASTIKFIKYVDYWRRPKTLHIPCVFLQGVWHHQRSVTLENNAESVRLFACFKTHGLVADRFSLVTQTHALVVTAQAGREIAVAAVDDATVSTEKK